MSIFLLLLISIYTAAGATTYSFPKEDVSSIKSTDQDNQQDQDEQNNENNQHEEIAPLSKEAVGGHTIDLNKYSFVIEEITPISNKKEHFEYEDDFTYISYLSNIFSSTIRVNAP